MLQLKAWEEYTSKLEEKYVALMTEHESFQRELAAVRGILDDGTDPDIHGTEPMAFPAQLLPLVTQILDTASIDDGLYPDIHNVSRLSTSFGAHSPNVSSTS